MSNQIVISSGAKVRSLEGVLTGSAGIVSSVPLGGANGVATLDSSGKVPLSQLPASVVTYLGTWNAATNTPTLANGTGDVGDLYICNVAGTVDFGAGPITFAVGDWVIYNGSQWQKSSGASGTVTSVAVTESGDALNITGSPITTAGTINIGFAGNSTQYINGEGNLVTFPTLITEAQNLITDVYNETGATLTKGTVVYINGGHGNLPTVTKALATSDATSAQTYGVVQADITNNNNGHVVVIGSLGDLDTQAYAAGTQLYLSSTTAGAWTSVKQYAPAHLVYVGIVVRSHPTQGVVEIKIQNGFELDELHNVSAQTPSNNDGLFYNSSNSLWENKSIATALGYTPANAANYVPYTGATQSVNLGNFGLSASALTVATNFILNSTFLLKKAGLGTTTPTHVSQFAALTGVGIGYSDGTGGGNFVFPTAAIYDYTFPASSGTLALTSNLSSYVPYTGATAAVNLGSNALTALTLYSNAGIALSLSGQFTGGGGYTGINGQALGIDIRPNSGGIFNLNFSSTTNRTFTFPDASGTLILGTGTTNYLPKFTGTSTIGDSPFYDASGSIGLNTITPALNGFNREFTVNAGTSGTARAAINIQGSRTSSSTFGVLGFFHQTNYVAGIESSRAGADNSGNLQFFTTNAGSIGERLTIASTGAATFSGQINTTSASGLNINPGTSGNATLTASTNASSYSEIQASAFGVGYNMPLILQRQGGNVGIGTSSPGDLLQLGSSSTRGTMSIFGTSSGVPVLQLNNTNASGGNAWNLYAGLSAAGSFNIYDNNATLTRFTITNSGNVGIGTSSPTSYSGYTTLCVDNSTSGGVMQIMRAGTPIMNVYSASGEGKIETIGTSTFFTITTNSTERMRITSDGYLLVGATSSSGFGSVNRISRATSQGNYVLSIDGGAGQDFSTLFMSVSGTTGSASLAAQWVGRNTSTGRSINAGGTINALGTDYAEYMTKAIEDNIAKGDIVGVDENGLLTNIFTDAKSFVIKSTNPSYVGGDTWGSIDIMGKLLDNATEQERLDYESKLEEARAKVDRIAFSGQVPCNVYNAQVGDYIIPIEKDGKITGQAVTNPTFEQYQISVGKVWKIMDDGRSWVAVKIG